MQVRHFQCSECGHEATSGGRCPACGEGVLVRIVRRAAPAAEEPEPEAVNDVHEPSASAAAPKSGSTSAAPVSVPGSTELPPALESERSQSRFSGPLGLILMAGGATALTALVFFAASIVAPDSMVGSLLLRRGWVPYAVMFLTAWAAADLVQRVLRLRREERALRLDLFSDRTRIGVEDAPRLLRQLAKVPSDLRGSYLVQRVDGALRQFAARGSVQEVSGHLTTQSESASLAAESSYTTPRVLIWAIPILGFIGTVLGISGAVGQFSTAIDATQELQQIKDSLGGVTTGLALAFDTTLLALVMSIVVMFPTSALQQREEKILRSVEDYCGERLLPRLYEPTQAESAAVDVRGALADEMGEYRRELREWTQGLESIGERMASQLVASWEQIQQRSQAQHEEQASRTESTLTEFVAGLDRLRTDQGEAWEASARSFNVAAEQLTKASEAISRQAQSVHQELSATLASLPPQVEDRVASIGTKVTDQWREQLTELGEVVRTVHEDILSWTRDRSEQLAGWSREFQETVVEARRRHAEEIGHSQTQLDDTLRRAGEQIEQTQKTLADTVELHEKTVEQLLERTQLSVETAERSSEETATKLQDTLGKLTEDFGGRLLESQKLQESQLEDAQNRRQSQLDEAQRLQQSQIEDAQAAQRAYIDEAQKLQQEHIEKAQQLQQEHIDKSQKLQQEHAEKVQAHQQSQIDDAQAQQKKLIEEALKQQAEALRQQTESLRETSDRIAATMAETQERLSEQARTMSEALGGHEHLTKMQANLAANLEHLSRSDDLRDTLKGLSEQTATLGRLLEALHEQAARGDKHFLSRVFARKT